MNHRTKPRKENPMKRPPKIPTDQFTLLLYGEPIHQFDGATKEKVLNALADLLCEALGEKTKRTVEQKEKSDESENHR
jgi:hypothetical protein